MNNTIDNARVQLHKHSTELLRRANVVATGIGYKLTAGKRTDKPCIICSVEKKVSISSLPPKDVVPHEFDGVATDVIQTGPIRALQSPTSRFRPAPGGISIGHRDITAGTLGCWVKRDGQWMILSNNHVLANSNDANAGDSILQPGPIDGGRHPQDQIAVLEDFIPITFPGSSSDCNIAGSVATVLNGVASIFSSNTRLQAINSQATDNLVDAAIARPLQQQDIKAEILHIGTVQGTAHAELGMAVKKSGRTTGFSEGVIQQIDVTVDVQYGAGRTARFIDQLMAGAMSQGGDSGSAVLTNQNQLVGLLFAGSDQSTIMNRIDNVFSMLRLTL